MNSEFFIALIPDQSLLAKIQTVKDFVYKKFGDQIYLSHSPHLTLFIGSSLNFNQTKKSFERFSARLAAVPCHTVDWLIFPKDKLTGKSTLALKICDEDIANLKKIQLASLEETAENKSKVPAEKFQKVSNFSEVEQDNLRKYGFPYVGENWIPHLTICSLDEEKISEITNHFEKPIFSKYLTKVALFQLNDLFDPIKSIDLR